LDVKVVRKIRTGALSLLMVLAASFHANASTVTIDVRNFSFSPKFITIDQGDTVDWHWVFGFFEVVSDPGDPLAFDSGFHLSPFDFFFTFTVAGLYPYFDAIHGGPGGFGESGVITVTAATPLPAALPLFATGLGAMGLLGWRRKRKNATPALAAT
jgi:plastocyanin